MSEEEPEEFSSGDDTDSDIDYTPRDRAANDPAAVGFLGFYFYDYYFISSWSFNEDRRSS